MLDQQQLQHLIDKVGLTTYKQKILDASQPSLRFVTRRDNAVPIGATRFGGEPDLPPSIPYPYHGDQPYDFIAQINLSSFVSHFSGGMLYFFHTEHPQLLPLMKRDSTSLIMDMLFGKNVNPQIPEWESLDRGLVLYFDGSLEELKRCPLPEDTLNRYHPCRVSTHTDWTIPGTESDITRKLIRDNTDSRFFEKYFELESAASGNGSRHRMFGHPDLVQSDVFNESEQRVRIQAQGKKINAKRYQDIFQKVYESGPYPEWKLLLQVDSDSRADFMWGDAGTLYFTIRQQDLENRHFDNIQCITQSG